MTAPHRPSRHWIRDPWPRTVEGQLAALQAAFPLWAITYEPAAPDGYPFRAWRDWPDGKGQSGRLTHSSQDLGWALARAEAEVDLW